MMDNLSSIIQMLMKKTGETERLFVTYFDKIITLLKQKIMSENTENRYWVGDTTFPENGKMVYALSDGEPITGVVYAVYEDGSLMFECGYKNGKQHGLLKSWYDDGQVLSVGHLKDGMRHGKITYWHRNGELDYEQNYVNDKKVE